ncbi:hypothetical protein G9A89_009915 [Geosiphon pyriformis]|nr:hypothetical protein G9A89_009915 [Geosiphon pyriformis]
MEPVGFFVGGFVFGLTELGSQFGAKKKSLLYKKLKKPDVTDVVVNSLAGPLPGHVLQIDCSQHKVSWNSKVESEDVSINEVFDIKNMNNMMAEKTSYIDSNTSETDDMLLKTPFFKNLNDDDTKLVLPDFRFNGFNCLSSVKSYVLERHSFKPVRSFTLDMKLAIVSEKTNRIIKSFFTSELSLNKISVNNNVRKPNSHLNREIIVKEILVDLLKSAVELVFSKFGKISIFMRKNSVHVALTIEDKQSWVFRDQHRALLYTLPVSITTHDLFDLLDSYGRKTCFIGHNLSSYVYNRCAVVCFADKASKLAAISFVSVFKSQFGHISDMCLAGRISGVCEKWVVTDQDQIHLAGIYKKKQALIAHLVAGGFFFHVASSVFFGVGLFLVAETSLFASVLSGNHDLYGCLAFLECSLELLANQVFGILKKLGFMKLVSLAVVSDISLLVVPVSVVSGLNLDMVLNGVSIISTAPPPVVNNTAIDLSSSSSKILTTKVGGLESKMVALEVSVEFVLEKLDCLCSGLGLSINNPVKQDDIIHWDKEMNNLISVIMNKFNGVWIFTSGLDSGHLDSGVAIIMDISLAKHMCKVSEVLGQLISLKLLFKNKLSVSILELYAAGDINFMIAKAINKSTFVILGGNFNKDNSHKCASFKKCLDLGLVNSLSKCSYVNMPTWANSYGMAKTIDFLFIFSNLVNAVVSCNVFNIRKFFDTDYQTMPVSVSLGGLLDMQLNFICKQANKDHWKFDFKNINEIVWTKFKNTTLANTAIFSSEFVVNVVHKMMCLLAMLQMTISGVGLDNKPITWCSNLVAVDSDLKVCV